MQIGPFLVLIQEPRKLTPYTRYSITWRGIVLRHQISMPCLDQCCDAAFLRGSPLSSTQKDKLRRSRALAGRFKKSADTIEPSTLPPFGNTDAKARARGTKISAQGAHWRAQGKSKHSQSWRDGKIVANDSEEEE